MITRTSSAANVALSNTLDKPVFTNFTDFDLVPPQLFLTKQLPLDIEMTLPAVIEHLQENGMDAEILAVHTEANDQDNPFPHAHLLINELVYGLVYVYDERQLRDCFDRIEAMKYGSDCCRVLILSAVGLYHLS